MKPIFYLLMLTALAAVIYNRRLLPKRLGAFIPLIALGIATQLLAAYWPGPKPERLTIFHIFQFLAYPLLAYYFYRSIRHRVVKWLFPASIPVVYLLALVYYLNFPQDWQEIFLPEQSLLSLMVVIGSLFIFFEMYTGEPMLALHRTPDFWIGTANLVYYAGYLLTLGSYRYVDLVLGDEKLANELIAITHWLNLLLYFLYTVGFLCPKKTPASSS